MDEITKLVVDLVRRCNAAEVAEEGLGYDARPWDSFIYDGGIRDIVAYLEREGIDTSIEPETGKE